METEQTQFWSGDFGKEYTDRNSRAPELWDQFYMDTYGKTKEQMNALLFEGIPKDIRILEVGCNTGMQLACLQRMGFKHLYGIELQEYAAERAKEFTSHINIIQGSGFDLPFQDNYFDLVCTNGVLIHIHPKDHAAFMNEMVRCSKKYIAGFEYYAETTETVNYRGHDGFLWKADFAKLFHDQFPQLEVVGKQLYTYIAHPELRDAMYLLEKK